MAQNIIDVIAALQGKGFNDAQIIAQLKNLGYTSQEISDAVNQVKAKAAVGGGENMGEQIGQGGMQPSIMESKAAIAPAEEIPVPSPTKKVRKAATGTAKARGDMSTQVAEAPPAYPYAYQAEATPGYAETPAEGTAGIGDIETIEEVAEEIVAEKFSGIRDKIEDVLNFKELIEAKINNLNDRLKRVELSIDRLQAALLGRVQEYSKDIKGLGSDMQALEGAFGKILNPLVDNVKELGSITEKIKKEKRIK